MRTLVFTVLLLASGSSVCQGAIIDWDNLSWNPDGSLSESFVIAGTNTRATFTFTGNTNRFTDDPNGNQTPTINNIQTGGLTPVQDVLNLRLDFQTATEEVVMTVTFTNATTGAAQLVDGVIFRVFDIDTDRSSPTYGWQDEIRVQGLRGTGTPTIVNPTLTDSADNFQNLNATLGNAVIGSNGNTSDTSAAANGTFNFGTNQIDRFTLTYGNWTQVQANPVEQRISIHDIAFFPSPNLRPGP